MIIVVSAAISGSRGGSGKLEKIGFLGSIYSRDMPKRELTICQSENITPSICQSEKIYNIVLFFAKH